MPRFTVEDPLVRPASFFARFPAAARASGNRKEVVWKCPVDDAGLGGAVREREQGRWGREFEGKVREREGEMTEEEEVEKAMREIEMAVGGVDA